MLCIALKEFHANGKDIVRHQLLEGDDFRNATVLIGQRYMRPATQDEIASAYDPDTEPAPVRTPMKAKKSSGLKAKVRRM